MTTEKYTELCSLFESKVDQPFETFKGQILTKITDLYFNSIQRTPSSEETMRKFIDKSFLVVLENIEHFNKNLLPFNMFFGNIFAMDINRQLYRYRLDNDFSGPMYNNTVTPADIVLSINYYGRSC